MSIYSLDHLITPPESPDVIALKLTERTIYGSSRVGTENLNDIIARSDVSFINEFDYVQTVGDKRYELSNHLGNVLQVLSDRKLAIDNGVYDADLGTYSSATPDGLVDYYIADVVSQSDYFPFGWTFTNTNIMPDKVYNTTEMVWEDEPASGGENDYRYGFNGMEDDEEVTNGNGQSYDFGARFYNPRVGRWLSRDAYEKMYISWSPYSFAINNPIGVIDINGDSIFVVCGNDLVYASLELLQETPHGNDLINKYANAIDKHIFITVDDLSNGVYSNAGAATDFNSLENNSDPLLGTGMIYSKEQLDGKKNVQPLRNFGGMDLSRFEGQEVSFICLNSVYFDPEGKSIDKMYLYGLAETIAHEIEAHIEAGNLKSFTREHEYYGATSSVFFGFYSIPKYGTLARFYHDELTGIWIGKEQIKNFMRDRNIDHREVNNFLDPAPRDAPEFVIDSGLPTILGSEGQ